MVRWIKDLVAFLLLSGLLLMLVPETGDVKQFLRLVVGLLLIVLMVQPLVGPHILNTSNEILARLQDSWWTPGAGRPEMGDLGYLEVQADRLVEKGSDVVREYMENQANKQVGALLSLFAGVNEAQVVTQVDSQGRLERVVVGLHMATDEIQVDQLGLVQSMEVVDDGSPVPVVQPILITEHAGPESRSPADDPSIDPLVRRIRNWVADFYGIEPESVIVTTL